MEIIIFLLLNIFTKMNYSNEQATHIIEQKGEHLYLIPKNATQEQTLIYLHGLGDSPMGYLDMFNHPNSPIPKNTKIILLCAPKKPVTSYSGHVMTSWFDIYKQNKLVGNYNFEDVKANSQFIIKIIEEEAKFYKGNYSKIFIGGFSQGACVSLHIGFTLNHVLGGVLSLSGILFPESISNPDSIKEKDKLPIFIGLGTKDNIIEFEKAEQSYKPIMSKSSVEVHTYKNMKHSICSQEEDDIKTFLESCINSN